MSTSKAQIESVRRYEAKNPGRTYYNRFRSSSFAFTRMRTEKAQDAIQAVGTDKYREDLEKLRDEISERLRELS